MQCCDGEADKIAIINIRKHSKEKCPIHGKTNSYHIARTEDSNFGFGKRPDSKVINSHDHHLRQIIHEPKMENSLGNEKGKWKSKTKMQLEITRPLQQQGQQNGRILQ